MEPIVPLLQCLSSAVTMTTVRQVSRIVLAMLAMTGRVTMLGIARWAGTGGSYRTIQRFFHTPLPWAALLWVFVRTHLLRPRDHYQLRFQIEFTFRDAKHYWGLEDFMVITEIAVTNAMNLACFMVNLSRCLMRDRPGYDSTFSVLDLKTHYRGLCYAEKVIKLLPEKPEPSLLQRILAQVTDLGRIHPLQEDSHTE